MKCIILFVSLSFTNVSLTNAVKDKCRWSFDCYVLIFCDTSVTEEKATTKWNTYQLLGLLKLTKQMIESKKFYYVHSIGWILSTSLWFDTTQVQNFLKFLTSNLSWLKTYHKISFYKRRSFMLLMLYCIRVTAWLRLCRNSIKFNVFISVIIIIFICVLKVITESTWQKTVPYSLWRNFWSSWWEAYLAFSRKSLRVWGEFAQGDSSSPPPSHPSSNHINSYQMFAVCRVCITICTGWPFPHLFCRKCSHGSYGNTACRKDARHSII